MWEFFFETQIGLSILWIVGALIYLGIGGSVAVGAVQRGVDTKWIGEQDYGLFVFIFAVIWPSVVVFIISQRYLKPILYTSKDEPE